MWHVEIAFLSDVTALVFTHRGTAQLCGAHIYFFCDSQNSPIFSNAYDIEGFVCTFLKSSVSGCHVCEQTQKLAKKPKLYAIEKIRENLGFLIFWKKVQYLYSHRSYWERNFISTKNPVENQLKTIQNDEIIYAMFCGKICMLIYGSQNTNPIELNWNWLQCCVVCDGCTRRWVFDKTIWNNEEKMKKEFSTWKLCRIDENILQFILWIAIKVSIWNWNWMP